MQTLELAEQSGTEPAEGCGAAAPGALAGRYTEIVKAVVQAWPLACLPVGALMETPCLSTLMTALDGLEALLTQKVSPR